MYNEDYLTEESSRTFYTTTMIQFWHGLLSEVELTERLFVLGDLCDPRNELLSRVLPSNGIDDTRPTEWIDNQHRVSKPKGHMIRRKRSSTKTSDMAVQFLTKINGILGSKWEFHPYDDDFFPSVPHGHLQKNKTIKLDSYLGYTFDTSKDNCRLKRESRKFIILLWNDDKFRDMARNSVEYYIVHHPNFNWRVDSPHRLPRKRKI